MKIDGFLLSSTSNKNAEVAAFYINGISCEANNSLIQQISKCLWKLHQKMNVI